MRVLPDNETGIREALNLLRFGGVVAHATETCYGLACDLRSPKAVAQVFAIKQRSVSQPISGLFSSVEEAQKYVEWTAEADDLAAKHLPGPLTLILPLRAGIHDPLYPTPNGGTTLGVRVSPHHVAMALATGCGFPLSTTSANIHGQSNPYSAEDILAQFRDAQAQPDLILDSGVLPKTPPSTVVDLAGKTESHVRRKGEIGI